MWPSFLILLLSLTPTNAYAGWLDQAGGLLNQLVGTKQQSPAAIALSNSDMIAGLKETLSVSAQRVVARLGKQDGFNLDPKIHIPLPDSLRQVKSALATIGMGSMMDDLELRLNRAAEAATPKAKRLFADAIQSMTISDARNILNGSNDAATRYFQKKMRQPLSREMRPIVRQAMAQTGAINAYDSIMGKYQGLPFVPNVKANLTQHVIDGGLKGIFTYMANEEAAIRRNPAKRTTELLKRIFDNH